MIERLSFDFEFKLAGDAAIGDLEGYGSVFNLVDRGGDLVMPGAFKASLADYRRRRQPIPMLWNHDPSQPIGVWTDYSEDEKGLKLAGSLIMEDPGAARARAWIQKGAVRGLSIGYQTRDYELDRQTGVRKLKRVDLWEVSLVTFAMLPEAGVTGVKGGGFDANAWERAFHDEGLSNREAKLATSVARKMVRRDGAPTEPDRRDGDLDALMAVRRLAAAFKG